MATVSAPNLPVTESVKFIESIYLQLGFLGLFIVALFGIIWFLYKQGFVKSEARYNSLQKSHAVEIEKKSQSHQVEWEKLKKEHHEDRKSWFETSEKRIDLIVNTMKENSRLFTDLIEGTVKENTKILSEVSSVIKNCQNNFH